MKVEQFWLTTQFWDEDDDSCAVFVWPNESKPEKDAAGYWMGSREIVEEIDKDVSRIIFGIIPRMGEIAFVQVATEVLSREQA